MRKLLLFLMVSLMLLPGYAWWDASYSYRKPINATENKGQTLTAYQGNLTIDTQTLIVAGQMQADGDDIRFVDTDDVTLLPYYIVSGLNTTTTQIIVKLASLAASSTEVIYMYYGNPSATQKSNPYGAYHIYDLFDDASFNTTTWTNAGVASVTESGGLLNATDQSTTEDDWLHSNTEIPIGSRAEFRFWIDGTATKAGSVGFGRMDWDTAPAADAIGFSDGGSSSSLQYHWVYNDTANDRIGGATKDAAGGVWGTGFIEWVNSSYVHWGWAGVENTTTTLVPTNNMNFSLFYSYLAGRNITYSWDWVKVYKYVVPEPTFSVGAEELAGNLSISIVSPAGDKTTENVNAVVVVSWSDPSSGYSTNYTVFAYLNDTYVANTSGTLASGANYTWSIGALDIYENTFEFKVNGTETNKSTSASETSTFNVNLYSLSITSPTADGNYYGNITTTFNATCSRSAGSITLMYWDGTTNYGNATKSCPSSSLVSTTRESSSEGNRTITVSLGPYDSRETQHNDSVWYYSDLYPPTLDYSSILFIGFRKNLTQNYTIQAEDSLNSTIACNFSFPSWNTSDLSLANATAYLYNFTLQDGTNRFSYTCHDQVHTIAGSESFTSYTKYFVLVDEDTGSNFTLSNANITVFAINTGTSYDFNAENTTWFYWTSNTTDSLRFEQTYEGYSDTIVRNFDVGLSYAVTPVCANVLDSFYEQIFYSTENKATYVISQYTGCYLVSDYTQYAYETAIMTFAHTVDKVYYLYVVDDDELVYLSSLDGSSASQVNLDVLKYNAEGFTLSSSDDYITFSKLSNSSIYVYYYNPKGDNAALTLTVKNGTATLFSVSDSTDPNDFAIYLDYSTMGLSVEVMSVTVNTTKTDGSTGSISTYFTLISKTATIPKQVTVVVAAIFLIFGISLVSMNIVAGWFGILIGATSIAITTFSAPSWEVLLFQGIAAIVTVFLGLMSFSGTSKLS